ncbi:MAG: hypothetical protein WA691_02285 [Thermoplasmata archaeon]
MVPSETPLRSPSAPTTPCPSCGGRLSAPVSGDVHCYVECTECRTRFELDDPELSDPAKSERTPT